MVGVSLIRLVVRDVSETSFPEWFHPPTGVPYPGVAGEQGSTSSAGDPLRSVVPQRPEPRDPNSVEDPPRDDAPPPQGPGGFIPIGGQASDLTIGRYLARTGGVPGAIALTAAEAKRIAAQQKKAADERKAQAKAIADHKAATRRSSKGGAQQPQGGGEAMEGQETAAQKEEPDTAAQPGTAAVPGTDRKEAVDHKPSPQAAPCEEDTPVDWDDDDEDLNL